MKTLRKSPKWDKDVEYLQNQLNKARAKVHGNWPCVDTKGVFNDDTEKAVKAFQVYSNISNDGIVGPITWGKLKEVCSIRHLIEPAICDLNIDTNSRLFMLSISNDPDEELEEDTIIASYYSDTTPIISVPSYVKDSKTFANNYVGLLSTMNTAQSGYFKYNNFYHVTNSKGITFSFQSGWNTYFAKYWRTKQIEPYANARTLGSPLRKAGYVMIGADILLSGEIRPSHGINTFMIAISSTGVGAIVAAGWFAIDMSVGGYNYLAHGEFETLSDKIDKKIDKKIDLDKAITQFGEQEMQKVKNGFLGSKI